ncbi:MAG: hypothetical protein E6H87_02670 [Chloroflexi bacterium]|nr:MAG: hypothetical protein E6H87_02670 [Chloroflexota bacterium]
MACARRVEKVLGHDPRPGWHGGRREPTREHARYAVGLAREERKELHLERVVLRHAFQSERSLHSLLAETNALDLDERVLRDQLAAHVAHIRAKASRDE